MNRPHVLINVAATADGKIDTAERRGAPISSDADRERVDGLRASVDAVMVGGRTLHDEDPRLTVKSPHLRAERLARGQPENPIKVAITSRLDFRRDARFLSSGPARIILFVPKDHPSPLPSPRAGRGSHLSTPNCLGAVPQQPRPARSGRARQPRAYDTSMAGLEKQPRPARGEAGELREPGEGSSAAVEIYECGDGRVDLVEALNKLHQLGVRRLLVEGGGSLNFELLRLGLVDELVVYTAPLVFGGASAPTLADGAGLPRNSAIRLQRTGLEACDDGGVLIRYKVLPS